MTAKICFTILQNQKTSWRFEPWPPMWQAIVLPLDYGFICRVMAKIVSLIVKEGGPTGPPPLGSQAYKIYVGSNRVKQGCTH